MKILIEMAVLMRAVNKQIQLRDQTLTLLNLASFTMDNNVQ